MSQGRLLQLSGVVVDLIYQVEQVPAAGTEAAVNSFMLTSGGGFNAMVAAQRAGMTVYYGGGHGTGLFADIVRRELGNRAIPLLQQQSPHADQGNSVVLVDQQGERTFISKEGADVIADEHSFDSHITQGFDWILLSGYSLRRVHSGSAFYRCLNQLATTSKLVFDPSPIINRLASAVVDAMLAKACWVSANAHEASTLTGIASASAAAQALADGLNDAAQGAIVRHGANGCWLARKHEQVIHIPGFEVDTVDTNGAGDAHIGTFIAALSAGSNAIAAARYANAAAALSTTRRGAATAPDDEATRALLDVFHN